MTSFQRIGRLQHPRSNRASTILLVVTFSVFALLANLADRQGESSAIVRESTPATISSDHSEHWELWSLLQHLRL